jgi:hypothetical protein
MRYLNHNIEKGMAIVLLAVIGLRFVGFISVSVYAALGGLNG